MFQYQNKKVNKVNNPKIEKYLNITNLFGNISLDLFVAQKTYKKVRPYLGILIRST